MNLEKFDKVYKIDPTSNKMVRINSVFPVKFLILTLNLNPQPSKICFFHSLKFHERPLERMSVEYHKSV